MQQRIDRPESAIVDLVEAGGPWLDVAGAGARGTHHTASVLSDATLPRTALSEAGGTPLAVRLWDRGHNPCCGNQRRGVGKALAAPPGTGIQDNIAALRLQSQR